MFTKSVISIDSTRKYSVSPTVRRIGRAIVFSLRDCDLPGQPRCGHVRILFRKGVIFTDDDVAQVNNEVQSWIASNLDASESLVSFHLTSDPSFSNGVLIAGELHNLCQHLRTVFSKWAGPNLKPPHYKIRRGRAGRCDSSPNNSRADRLLSKIRRIQRIKEKELEELKQAEQDLQQTSEMDKKESQQLCRKVQKQLRMATGKCQRRRLRRGGAGKKRGLKKRKAIPRCQEDIGGASELFVHIDQASVKEANRSKIDLLSQQQSPAEGFTVQFTLWDNVEHLDKELFDGPVAENEMLVTGNKLLFRKAIRHGIRVVKPKQFFRRFVNKTKH